MDGSVERAASPQFSPSKAQAQQAQAKDWASVDAWLSRRYAGKKLPAFERNEETLQALLTLATLNESADELRGHIDRIEKVTLSAHYKRLPTLDKTYHMVLSGLQDQEHLDALAETLAHLSCPDVDIAAAAAAIVNLTSRDFALDQQVKLLNSQISILKSEQHRSTKILDNLKQDHFEAPSSLPHETSESVRSAKHMKAKIAEYDDRLSGQQLTQSSGPRLQNFILETEDLQAQLGRLAQFRAELGAFQSLPTNVKAAHTQLESARENLLFLTRKRDLLFEQLASSG